VTITNAPWFSSETIALYKSLTYLLTIADRRTTKSDTLHMEQTNKSQITDSWKKLAWSWYSTCDRQSETWMQPSRQPGGYDDGKTIDESGHTDGEDICRQQTTTITRQSTSLSRHCDSHSPLYNDFFVSSANFSRVTQDEARIPKVNYWTWNCFSWTSFLPPKQQHQGTEGLSAWLYQYLIKINTHLKTER